MIEVNTKEITIVVVVNNEMKSLVIITANMPFIVATITVAGIIDIILITSFNSSTLIKSSIHEDILVVLKDFIKNSFISLLSPLIFLKTQTSMDDHEVVRAPL